MIPSSIRKDTTNETYVFLVKLEGVLHPPKVTSSGT